MPYLKLNQRSTPYVGDSHSLERKLCGLEKNIHNVSYGGTDFANPAWLSETSF